MPGTAGFGAYITGYCDKRFDPLVERAATLGSKDRTPLLQDAQRVLYEASPVISLYFPQGTYAYRADAYAGWAPETGHGIWSWRAGDGAPAWLDGERRWTDQRGPRIW